MRRSRGFSVHAIDGGGRNKHGGDCANLYFLCRPLHQRKVLLISEVSVCGLKPSLPEVLNMSRAILLCLVVGVLTRAGPAYAQWSPLSIVDTTTPNLTYQQDASTDVARDGTLGVVWQEITSDRRNPIVFAKSTDQGQTFQKYIVIDSVLQSDTVFGTGSARYVHDFKFGPEGTIWILWSHFLIYDFYDVASLRLSKSADGGATFSQVFSTPRASTTFHPQLAVARDSSVFVLWDDNQFKCTRFFHGIVPPFVEIFMTPRSALFSVKPLEQLLHSV
jgi:hypothetical protein